MNTLMNIHANIKGKKLRPKNSHATYITIAIDSVSSPLDSFDIADNSVFEVTFVVKSLPNANLQTVGRLSKRHETVQNEQINI